VFTQGTLRNAHRQKNAARDHEYCISPIPPRYCNAEQVNGIRSLCGLPKKGQRTNTNGFAKTKLKPTGLDDVITIIYEKVHPTLACGKAHVDSIQQVKAQPRSMLIKAYQQE
jgi:hypothetical protein